MHRKSHQVAINQRGRIYNFVPQNHVPGERPTSPAELIIRVNRKGSSGTEKPVIKLNCVDEEDKAKKKARNLFYRENMTRRCD